MAKITYTNKVALNPQPSIARENKVIDDDMNEIKTVVNTNAGVCDYSTSETSTGKTWIDGKPIYRIVIEETGLTVDTEYVKSFSNYGISNVNSSTIVKLEGYEYSDTLFLPMSEYSGFTNYLYITSGTSIKFKPGFTTNVRIIMEYTKTSD